MLGLLIGAGVLYFFLRPPSPSAPPVAEEPEEVSSPPKEASRGEDPPRPVRATDHVEPAPVQAAAKLTAGEAPSGPVQGIRVALVIDDLGRSLEDLRPLESLGVPVTYAVLPFEEHTSQVVAELRRRGVEMLLHLPMEPKNGEDPGPGALRRGMDDEELRERTLAALKAVPGAVGVNNHMGSGLSADHGPMTTILSLLAERRLFFLDSRTSAESVGYRVALDLGIPAAERQVFLDGDLSPEAIRGQFQRLLAVARTHGAAIAIGHPFPETLEALKSEVPRAKAEGYEFVPVSYLLTRPGDAE
ncbi:MAG TPA: divergent polysaccharide deacetylase family protein [Thermoanaerobaculia bacterium]|nr:divergent polysaccharide deacetylase family protein [Thermoanaerobaculia bacterium]